MMSISQTVAEIGLWQFSIFQDGGRPPSWICRTDVWATHDEYLVVFITVQDLVGIDAAVSIIRKFQYFCELGLKTPQNGGSWGFDP